MSQIKIPDKATLGALYAVTEQVFAPEARNRYEVKVQAVQIDRYAFLFSHPATYPADPDQPWFMFQRIEYWPQASDTSARRSWVEYLSALYERAVVCASYPDGPYELEEPL